MFPDSAISSNFYVSQDKISHMNNLGIAPYVKEQVKNNTIKAEYVVVTFDESLNHTTQKCQMGLHLRHWNNHG